MSFLSFDNKLQLKLFKSVSILPLLLLILEAGIVQSSTTSTLIIIYYHRPPNIVSISLIIDVLKMKGVGFGYLKVWGVLWYWV